MKKSKSLILLALLLTVISTFFLYRYIESLRQVPDVQVKYGNVVIASTDIPQHVKITEEMITLKNIPQEAIHKDAVITAVDVIGLTTNVKIIADEQILKSKIASSESTKNSLSYKIPENMRAIVIPTSEVSGLAGYLAKGDKVDILVTYSDRPGPGPLPATTPGNTVPESTQPSSTAPAVSTPVSTTAPPTETDESEYIETITQLQNIEVLELGVKQGLNENGETVVVEGVPTSVTLMATPQQAEVIAFMINNGTIQLTLRNPVDGVKVPLNHYGTDNFNDWRNR